MVNPPSILNSETSLLSPESIAASDGKTSRDTPEAIGKAATAFESLLIGEVLKSAREADGSGWMGTDDEEAGSSLMQMSEQQLSQTLAASGGLGLAKMISAGLAKTEAKVSGKAESLEKR
jgi:Rod binding domain-containing protein